MVDLCPGCEAKDTFEANLDPKTLPRGSFVSMRRRRDGDE